MEYIEQAGENYQVPFHLNFPDKQDSALWLSVAILRNFLLDDYVNQPKDRVTELNIKIGEKIEIFGAIAVFKGLRGNNLLLKFSDQNTPIGISKKLTEYINRTPKRSINKYSLFYKKKKNAKEGRNAISKLLEPNEPILINNKILKSKVLVIAGRGNTGRFTNRLRQENLYKTSLYDLFNCGENLIIKPDLEDFAFITKKENSDNEKKFEQYFLKFIDEIIQEFPNRKNDIKDLELKVRNRQYRNRAFLDKSEEILEESEPDSKFRKLIEIYYPGIKDKLPTHLKSVIINDITLLDTYHGIVKELINRKIPVLVISNKFIEDKKALSFFSNYFGINGYDLRINWNKRKISTLKEIKTDNKDILDAKLWRKCLKYSNQNVLIKTTTPHPADPLIIELWKDLSKIEGQERLKKAYWQYFNPLTYSFKNSIGWKFYHNILLDGFLSVFEEIKFTLDDSLVSKFYEVINLLKNYKLSFKSFDINDNLLKQRIVLTDRTISFPYWDYQYVFAENIDITLNQLTFPGYPLNEPINKYLSDVISEHVVENIKLVCWPNEARITYRYVKNRLKAGYFSDNFPKNWMIPDELVLRNDKDINDEIDEFLIFDHDDQIKLDEDISEIDEETLKKISSFKYSSYQANSSSNSDGKVVCNIIDLEQGKFMFLPKKSSVLAKIETEGNKFHIRKLKIDDLNVGDEIFQYELSRHILRKLSKIADQNDDIFKELYIWKNSLNKSFKEHDYNINKLLLTFKKINNENQLNASPTYSNLRNWIYDEDILSPEEQNLKMILLADTNPQLITNFQSIYDAYKKASSLSRKISTEIKKLIVKKLNSFDLENRKEFDIKLFGIDMHIEFRKIRDLQKTDIEIEYQHTRKIIS